MSLASLSLHGRLMHAVLGEVLDPPFSRLIILIVLDKDLYIESDLKRAPKTFGKASLQEEICRMDLTLFKVSS